jgi:cellulose synthase/poly-beta-1,6-N-acetylglucosamine synthase-like glycosyltransferase
MAAARGEIVVFSDANNLYDPSALRELVRPFADPQVGGVSGAKVIQKGDGALGESEGTYWKYESWVKKQETRLGSTTGVAGEIFAIRRALYEPAPESIINEDFYIAMRLIRRGWRVVYAPLAISRERVSATAEDEMTRRARIVAGRYQAISLSARLLPWNRPLVVWQVLSHKFLRPLVPLAMLGALLANLWAVFFPPVSSSFWRLGRPGGWLLLALQGLFYLAAWAGARLNLPGTAGRLPGTAGSLLYLPAFLVNSNLAALIGLARFLRRSQPVLWQRVKRRN